MWMHCLNVYYLFYIEYLAPMSTRTTHYKQIIHLLHLKIATSALITFKVKAAMQEMVILWSSLTSSVLSCSSIFMAWRGWQHYASNGKKYVSRHLGRYEQLYHSCDKRQWGKHGSWTLQTYSPRGSSQIILYLSTIRIWYLWIGIIE